jgi:hypothetical protein
VPGHGEIAAGGVLIYLNADGRIRDAVSQVVPHGGTVVQPIHAIGPHGSGPSSSTAKATASRCTRIPMPENDHFVAGGYERACAAALPQIRAELEREYRERLAAAGWLQRWRLRREMNRQIRKRLDRIAPRWGLYSSTKS